MKTISKLAIGIGAIVGIAAVGVAAAAPYGNGGARGPGYGVRAAAGVGGGPGLALRTPEERATFVQKMRNATPEERAKLMAENHALMQKRLQERVPAQP